MRILACIKKYQCIIVPVKAHTCCEFTATESIILTIHIQMYCSDSILTYKNYFFSQFYSQTEDMISDFYLTLTASSSAENGFFPRQRTPFVC